MALDSSNKVPGSYIEMLFGAGTRSPGDEARRIAMVGYKTAAGTATVERLVLVTSPDDAKTIFGQGSELARMVVDALAVHKGATIYGLPLNEPGAGVAATKTITFVGGPSTVADVTLLVEILGEQINVPIPVGSSITQCAAAVALAINNMPDLPVTAVGAVGVCTVTARHKGLRGNRISLRSSGTITSVTTTHATGYMTGGTTVDSLTNALAELAPQRFHYLCVPHDDSASLVIWRNQVNTYALPIEGKRQALVAATIDTLANAITLAQSINAERGQIVWHYNSDDDPATIAASMAALRARLESVDPGVPFFGVERCSMTTMRAQPVAADQPTSAEAGQALNAGLTPLGVTRSGVVYVIRGITTKSQDAAGKPFYAVLDTAKVTVPDYVADDIDANWGALTVTNPKQGPDPADGESPPPGVLTPLMVRDFVYGRLKLHEDNGLVENVDANLDSLVVTRATSPAGRFVLACPCDVIEGAYQLDGQVRQVG